MRAARLWQLRGGAFWSACLALGLVGALSSQVFGQSATMSILLNSTTLDRGLPVTGSVTITPSGSGLFDLTVDLIDTDGRVADRYINRLNLTGSTAVPFALASQYFLTMYGRVVASGHFVGGASAPAATRYLYIMLPPFDYRDYWCNVWGDGATNNVSYWTSLTAGHVNLGHIYRNASYYGYLYNIRPNNDFLEDKVWFEMTDTMHNPNYTTYQPALTSNNNYYLPDKRAALVRPTSLNDEARLLSLENTIRPRMQASSKFRPVQWNISDEYGIGRRGSPFDYDLGPAAMGQFVTWLQGRYVDINDLNAKWNTSFASFNGLLDPINAPRYGQAAMILTQEIRDREFPLNNSTTAAKNFAPWGEFRTFMDITFAAAMKRCVDVGRSIDASIRVGFEGAEPATPLTGYDYARQLREIGSIEAYDIANSPEYIRSMRVDRYGQKIFSFITLFDSGTQHNKYTLWYRLLHYGVTGAPIWWNQNFFGAAYALTSYATGVAPTFEEFQSGLVRLLEQGDWDDSEVALLYSQKSIQINYMVDSEADGKTWIKRLNSTEPTYNSMFYVHTAWCKALEDIGLKGRFISYDEVAEGVLTSRGVKVLVLPRALALSDAEKSVIEAWVNGGGVLIADNMCGEYDEYLRRRSIADGGGWWDSFLGITRTNYASVDVRGTPGSAFSGTPAFQSAPAGFAALTDGLSTDGLYAVENGVRPAAGSTPLVLFAGNSARPALIVKSYGTGKIVYMNLSLHRYGYGNPGVYTSERYTPGSISAGNIRHLVKNLVALGGVAPKVAVKQNHNNPSGEEVYNLEKSLRIDGDLKYLTCVVNSYQDVDADNWGLRSDVAAALFGQPDATEADITLALASTSHVYDVRKGQYLGYGTSINATMPVYEGAVFALLPYQVNSLSLTNITFDPVLHRTNVMVHVVADDAEIGNHLLRMEVFTPAGQSIPSMTQKVVATGGEWAGVVPFGASDTLNGSKVRFTDLATGISVEKVLTQYIGDTNGDGFVNVGDLQRLIGAWVSNLGEPAYSAAVDLNGDRTVNVADLQLLVANWGQGG